MMKQIIIGFYLISKDSGNSDPESGAAVWVSLFSMLFVVSTALIVELLVFKYFALEISDTEIYYGALCMLSAYFFGFVSYIRLRKLILSGVQIESDNIPKLKFIAVTFAVLSILLVFAAYFFAAI